MSNSQMTREQMGCPDFTPPPNQALPLGIQHVPAMFVSKVTPAIMIPIAKGCGMAALMGGIVIGGIFHFFLGRIIARIRHWLPPLVTGLIGLMIGLALVRVSIQYAAAGAKMLSSVNWNRRNMMIFAIALSIGLGLQLEPGALQHLPATAKVLMTAGLLPAALIAIVLNLMMPEETEENALGNGDHE